MVAVHKCKRCEYEYCCEYEYLCESSQQSYHSQGFQVAEERESLAELGPWRSLGVEIEE